LTVETPDAQFDRAIRWAEIAISQCRVKFHQETGLAAGFNESGNSMRPGFGWFFGRDTLWTLYAIHAYGDFPLARDAIEFLIRRQRDDGKIMHEYSQTADLVDWKATSYFYAAADSTPLFVMAMEDYVNTSGDRAFLGKHWDAVKRAYAFTRTHDSDGDGIYENTEGTGRVESWPSGMPHQEIYLAALDQQSAGAMSRLAVLMNDDALAANARQRAEKIRAAIEREYYEPAHQFYAFSRNANGTLDHAATIYPAVAWWTGRFALAHSGPMLTRWASSEFSADWGTRDLSNRTPFYDPISYHQGSIWPLFTGWVSLAEYRAGRPLSGYAHLMQNADLTWAQDLGAVTELLSGDFFQPLGRSTPHQLWCSGMLLSPALRGLFGLDWDALHKTLRLAPHLPANWDSARLRNVPLGDAHFDVEYLRQAGQLLVRAHSNPPEVLCLVPQTAAYTDCSSQPAATHEVAIPLPPVELALPHELPLPGAQTADLKVLDEEVSPARVSVSLEAPGGTVHDLVARWNSANVRVSGAERIGDKVSVEFPPGAGYQHKTITFSVQQGLP
jgi:glycogen debranching enzyme